MNNNNFAILYNCTVSRCFVPLSSISSSFIFSGSEAWSVFNRGKVNDCDRDESCRKPKTTNKSVCVTALHHSFIISHPFQGSSPFHYFGSCYDLQDDNDKRLLHFPHPTALSSAIRHSQYSCTFNAVALWWFLSFISVFSSNRSPVVKTCHIQSTPLISTPDISTVRLYAWYLFSPDWNQWNAMGINSGYKH